MIVISIYFNGKLFVFFFFEVICSGYEFCVFIDFEKVIVIFRWYFVLYCIEVISVFVCSLWKKK